MDVSVSLHLEVAQAGFALWCVALTVAIGVAAWWVTKDERYDDEEEESDV